MKNRYLRQLAFLPIGKKGQKKILEGKATVIGLGGLGSNIVSNLARAGIGFLKIIDNDFPDITNLHRQILFDEEDLIKKESKSIITKEKLKKINSDVFIEDIYETINENNVYEIIENSDIVIDGTDNFETKFLINKACIDMKIPLIFGSAAASNGMISSIIPGETPCLKCIFPKIPDDKFNLTAMNSGVLNTIVNIVASIQTTEAMKYLTGNYDSMIKGLLIIDIWNFNLDIISIRNKNLNCPVCN
ncbi:MAG: HesA/MoeB/ThiF family protein [Actinomycetota bacterium]|nr:HesA/MoeB/ThiF family protein [Actinomycetota bacterium]